MESILMMNDLERWAMLADSSEPEAREDVSLHDCDEASRENLAAIQRALHTELNIVATHAKKLADGFWELNKEMRESDNPELRGYFGTRVRLRGNALSIDWYRNYFIQEKATGRKRPMSKYITKGEGFRYSRKSFKGATEWEQETIEAIEDQYAVLRKRAHLLRTMRRAMSEYQELMKGEDK